MREYDNICVKRFVYFNLYVIKGKTGDILIDTGFIGIKRSLKKWLDNFNIRLVILTHAHVDHVWNACSIKEWYGCDIAIGKSDIVNLDNSLIKSKALFKKYEWWTKLMNLGMKMFKFRDFDIDMMLRDKQVINRYGIKLKIVSLPGHTTGAIGVLYNNYLFLGDALVYRGKYPSLAFQNQDTDLAYETLKKIININPEMIFLGHDHEFVMTNDIRNELINFSFK